MSIVTICGSTRFKEEIMEEAERLTMEGHLVFMPNVFGHADDIDLSEEEKDNLDYLHKLKIDQSDRIHVVDVHGYIGDSTQEEIDYAKELNIPVTKYSNVHRDPLLDKLGKIVHGEWKETPENGKFYQCSASRNALSKLDICSFNYSVFAVNDKSRVRAQVIIRANDNSKLHLMEHAQTEEEALQSLLDTWGYTIRSVMNTIHPGEMKMDHEGKFDIGDHVKIKEGASDYEMYELKGDVVGIIGNRPVNPHSNKQRYYYRIKTGKHTTKQPEKDLVERNG